MITEAYTFSTFHYLLLVDDLATQRKHCQEDEKFNVLCSRSKMHANIGKMISLPSLPNDICPKGFDDTSSFEKFLLTEERYRIYEEIDRFVCGESTSKGNAGFVPSGPHGFGKTAIGLLLACYGFANKQVVIYIVSTNR